MVFYSNSHECVELFWEGKRFNKGLYAAEKKQWNLSGNIGTVLIVDIFKSILIM